MALSDAVITGSLETIHEDTLEGLATIAVNQDFFSEIETIAERLGLGEVTEHSFRPREPRDSAYAATRERFFGRTHDSGTPEEASRGIAASMRFKCP